MARPRPRRQRFQSTLPVRGATFTVQGNEYQERFQSTLPVRGATAKLGSGSGEVKFQSTLPVRGATEEALRGHQRPAAISIHAPRAGSDLMHSARFTASARFQSTLPVRGATWREEDIAARIAISIHAPRAGSDGIQGGLQGVIFGFQSTLPVRGATQGAPIFFKALQDFNPRSPCGERRAELPTSSRPWNFNPRSPCGERL